MNADGLKVISIDDVKEMCRKMESGEATPEQGLALVLKILFSSIFILDDRTNVLEDKMGVIQEFIDELANEGEE